MTAAIGTYHISANAKRGQEIDILEQTKYE